MGSPSEGDDGEDGHPKVDRRGNGKDGEGQDEIAGSTGEETEGGGGLGEVGWTSKRSRNPGGIIPWAERSSSPCELPLSASLLALEEEGPALVPEGSEEVSVGCPPQGSERQRGGHCCHTCFYSLILFRSVTLGTRVPDH